MPERASYEKKDLETNSIDNPEASLLARRIRFSSAGRHSHRDTRLPQAGELNSGMELECLRSFTPESRFQAESAWR